MVSPVAGWHELQGRHALFHAILWQWLLLSLAEIVAIPAMQVASGQTPDAGNSWLRIVGILIGFLPLTLLLNAAFAALGWLFFRVVGLPRSFGEFLQWTANGMLPMALGAFLGRLSLELAQPMLASPGMLAPLQFRGISLGLASWFPASFPLLEFGWVSMTFLDVFGIWSIVLLGLGLRHYLKASRTESLMASLAMLVLCFLLLTGAWQMFQRLGSVS